MSLAGSFAAIGNHFAPWLPPQPGWIGVDIGSRAIKLAQLVRTGDEYRIAARWTLVDEIQPLLTRDDLARSGLATRTSAIKSLRRMFVGRACAAVIPMSAVEMRSFEIPSSDPYEQRVMAGEELATDLGVEPSELMFECWPVASDGDEESGMTRVAVLAVQPNVASRTAVDLLAAGLECQALNGVPCALARAVEIAGPSGGDDVVAAIDLGYQSPLLVIVRKGQPLFSRVLRGGSLQSIMQPLQSELKLTAEECLQLLIRYGVPRGGQETTVGSQATMRLVAKPLEVLFSELQRTIGYLEQQFRDLKPRRLQLFGGGAMIHNLPELIAEKMQVPAASWTLGNDSSHVQDASYGVAAALSSLYWEKHVCT